MRNVWLSVVLLVVLFAAPATGQQGIPDRVAALEQKVAVLENGLRATNGKVANLEGTLAIANVTIANLTNELQMTIGDIGRLRQELRAVDQGSGLVRTFRESYAVHNGSVSPAPRAFPDRGPIAAIVQQTLGGGGRSFIVFNGGEKVRADCAEFTLAGSFSITSAGSCGVFDVLYLFSGPPF